MPAAEPRIALGLQAGPVPVPIYALVAIAPDLPEDGAYWLAPDAVLLGKVRLDSDVSIWFGAVLRGDNELIHIGGGSNIQDRSVCHTDMGFPLTVGPGCTIGHAAVLHGCTIGENCLVGMGATIMNGARVGRNCLIGAQALVPEGKIIPDNSLVMGAPGRIVRQVSDEEAAKFTEAARIYQRNWRRYASGLALRS
jgi:carbonic anhydrase/acetyltransferase-like protein (isoleucine patch superfamily)